MKKWMLFVLVLCLSCKEYNAIMSEDVKNHRGEKLFFVDREMDIVEVDMNSVKHQLLFDTGAGGTVLYNPKFQIDPKKIIKDKSVYGFDKKTKTIMGTYSVESVQTSIFSIKNKYLYLSSATKSLCQEQKKYDGILNNFYEEDAKVELNYQDGYISFTDVVPNEEYTELNAKFSSYTGKFSIALVVNGIEEYFLFDTGNKAMTLLNPNVFDNSSAKEYTIQTLINTVGGPTKIDIDVYQMKISMGETLNFDFPIGIDPSSNRSVLSKSFIAKFNWIIDVKRSKIYCKPINREKLTASKNFQKKADKILCAAINDNLLISYRNIEGSNFRIADQIIAVNDEKVTLDNICNMQKLLNTTVDWSTLKLEIIPSLKEEKR